MALGAGIAYARDLVNEPPSSLYPETFAKKLLELKKHGIQVQVHDEKALAKMGAGGILAVAQGSQNPPRPWARSAHRYGRCRHAGRR